MIYIIRASHANEFELQNYHFPGAKKDVKIITSHHPLTGLSLPHISLWSLTDLPSFPLRRQICNRLFGGDQWLFGLNQIISQQSNGSNHRTVLHTAETYTPYTHQAVKLRQAGLISKLICTCWETIPHNNEKFPRLRKWKRETYQYVDLFHVPTERAKQALLSEGVDPQKIVVIPYGVDLTRFKHLQGQSLKGNQRPLILTVARLEKEKGIEELELVAKALPQYDFKVIGRGRYSPQGANIQTLSVPYPEIHKIYQKADLFFLPSCTTPTWEEQYGMSLVEAMACGLPIVASESGAITEVLGPAGITHQVCDTEAMIDAISDIISNKDKSNKLSKLSLARARKLYDAKKCASMLATLYR